MCEFHNSNSNGLGDIWWTDKCMYFSSIDNIRHKFYVKSSSIGQSATILVAVSPMETKDSTFHLEPHGQQNVAGIIFVDHSNRPFLFMIATLRYARQ